MREDPVGDVGFDFATASVAATILALAALQTSWGTMADPDLLGRLGAWTDADGWWQPWRLLSCTFVHGSPLHLASNLVGLGIYGWPLERAVGWRRMLLLYVGAALAGSLGGVGLERPAVLVGASGAIFGLYGAMAALAVRPRRMLHAGELAVLREALWPVGVVQVAASFTPGVAWGTHLGGLLVGLVAGGSGLLVRGLPPRAPEIGWASGPDASTAPEPEVAWGRALVTTLLVAILAFGCPAVMIALLLGYVLVVGFVARAEPRYFAPDGIGVTGAALFAAVALWGSATLAIGFGQPWHQEPPPIEPLVGDEAAEPPVEPYELPTATGIAPRPP